MTERETVRERRDRLLVDHLGALRFAPFGEGVAIEVIETYLRPFDYVLAPCGGGRW